MSTSVQSSPRIPPRLWKVYRASGVAERAFDLEIPLFAEWLRLLVGRSLAFAQSGERGLEYLVLGIGLDELAREPGARAGVLDALDADFAVLGQVIRKHAEIVKREPAGSEQPLTFTRAYLLLAQLRLPTSDEHWIVTDEGLSITNWGLQSGRFLFDWSNDELQGMQHRLRKRVEGKLPVGEVKEQAGAGRVPNIEAQQQAAQIEAMLTDPVASKKQAPEPISVGADAPFQDPIGRSPAVEQVLPKWMGRSRNEFAVFCGVTACMLVVIGFFAGGLTRPWLPTASSPVPAPNSSIGGQQSEDRSASSGRTPANTTANAPGGSAAGNENQSGGGKKRAGTGSTPPNSQPGASKSAKIELSREELERFKKSVEALSNSLDTGQPEPMRDQPELQLSDIGAFTVYERSSLTQSKERWQKTLSAVVGYTNDALKKLNGLSEPQELEDRQGRSAQGGVQEGHPKNEPAAPSGGASAGRTQSTRRGDLDAAISSLKTLLGDLQTHEDKNSSGLSNGVYIIVPSDANQAAPAEKLVAIANGRLRDLIERAKAYQRTHENYALRAKSGAGALVKELNKILSASTPARTSAPPRSAGSPEDSTGSGRADTAKKVDTENGAAK